MYFSDQMLSTPAENLALEEAWLEMAEQGQWSHEVLRIWQPDRPFVVVGRGSRISQEVHVGNAVAAGVPVLRRASGGAAVVAGPGCLMYALLLSYNHRPHLRMLDQAHALVMQTIVSALRPHCPELTWQGTCDLVLPEASATAAVAGGLPSSTGIGQAYRKVSGNSLRCRRDWMLYHGTLLLAMDLDTIEQFLLHPPREPEYRAKRPHSEFVANLQLPARVVTAALARAWQTQTSMTPPVPRELVHRLVAERYDNRDWTYQR